MPRRWLFVFCCLWLSPAVLTEQVFAEPVFVEPVFEGQGPAEKEGKEFVVGTFSFVKDIKGPNRVALLVGRALSEYGYQMRLEYMPGKRLMAQLNTGAIDADLVRAIDLSRGFENIVRVEEPISRVCGLIYRLKERDQLALSDAESPASLGVYAGAPGVASTLLRKFPSVELVSFKTLAQGVKMLMHERIDFLVIPDVQAPALITGTDKPLSLASVFKLGDSYLHVHKRHDELAVRLAASIKLLKRRFPLPGCAPEASSGFQAGGR